MDLSPSNSLKMQFLGLLRSSHALLGVICVIALVCGCVFVKLDFLAGAYACCGVFVVLALIIGCRFALKGPEADRVQPTLSVVHEDNRVQTQILNYDNTMIMAALQAVVTRRPLPPPSGIVNGLASDPKAIQLIDEEAARALQQEDSQLLIPLPAVHARSQNVSPPVSLGRGGAELSGLPSRKENPAE